MELISDDNREFKTLREILHKQITKIEEFNKQIFDEQRKQIEKQILKPNWSELEQRSHLKTIYKKKQQKPQGEQAGNQNKSDGARIKLTKTIGIDGYYYKNNVKQRSFFEDLNYGDVALRFVRHENQIDNRKIEGRMQTRQLIKSF